MWVSRLLKGPEDLSLEEPIKPISTETAQSFDDKPMVAVEVPVIFASEAECKVHENFMNTVVGKV